ncbi:MAG: AAA family ATPase [Chloroflexota bacterium]
MFISGPVTGEKFVNRKEMLAQLKQHAADRQYCTLIGLRRTGKTSLMIKTMEYLPPEWMSGYFNVQNSIAVPEQFAITYVGSVLFWILHRQGLVAETTQPHFYDLNYVQRQALLLDKQQVTRYLLDMADALDRREVNYQQVISQAFSFPQILSDALGRPLAIFIDEFQDIVQMDAYGIDSLKIFRSITQMQTGVWYCLAGSSIHRLNEVVNSQDSPLYGQYKTYVVGAFEIDAAHELTTQQVGEPLPEPVLALLYHFTGGYPFYLAVLGGTAAAMARREGRAVDETIFIQAIAEEVATPGGAIAMHCREVFETRLLQATQSTVSRQIMHYLAHNQPAKASDVGRAIGRSTDYTRQILVRLVEGDLLHVQKRRYAITDPILTFWLAHSYFDIEINPLAMINFAATQARLVETLRQELLPELKARAGL